MRPHQELIQKNECPDALLLNFRQEFHPERLRRRLVVVWFVFVAPEDLNAALTEQLPGNEVPGHAELSSFTVRRFDQATSFPVYFVE